MRKIFKNSILQNEFDEKGYTLINQFLNNEQITFLRDIYFSTPNDLKKGFHATTHSKNVEYRKFITEKISKEMTPKVDDFLKDYSPLVGTFTVKEVGLESFFDFHLDWNMVDERKSRSVTVWVALDDANEFNGNLWVLEGSHKLGLTFRGSPGLMMFVENKSILSEKKFKKKALKMKSGDAIIYDHRLIHGSPPNLSNKVRLAINMVYIASEDTPVHYVCINEKISMYKVNQEFFHICMTCEDIEMSGFEIVEISNLREGNIKQEEINKMIV
jgi:ectoine hydroxylase-related dioxygenase (phytanoyl-CoA dioxygenase family)